jgi:hypothetical protein
MGRILGQKEKKIQKFSFNNCIFQVAGYTFHFALGEICRGNPLTFFAE